MERFRTTPKDVIGVTEMLATNNNLARWSSITSVGYNESAKQALNCQIAIIMAGFAKHEGMEIDCSLFPRIALFRGFEKSIKCDITSEAYDELLSDEASKKAFNSFLQNEIENMGSSELKNHICGLENTNEMKLFKAATAVATYIEILGIKSFCPPRNYARIKERQDARLENFEDFPIVKDIQSETSELRPLFEDLYNLRNRVRWIRRTPLVKYNVLGHCWDVGILNYLLCLAEDPDNLQKAYQGFAVGLFHDIAENWTGDIPSPVKDGVPGLRKITEDYEVKVLKREVFTLLPDWFIPEFSTYMLEMLPVEDQAASKEGDILAAVFEAIAQMRAGSNDPYFNNVVQRYAPTSAICKALKKDIFSPQ